MQSRDIFFKLDDFIFSYRLAGILIKNGKVLLQKALNEVGYAFPGGQAAFPESNEQTLKREFLEEIAADVNIKDLKWVGEIFFPFQGKPCHQICLFYLVELQDDTQIPLEGSFLASESFDGKTFELEFAWISLSALDSITLYPPIAKELLQQLDGGVEHFVYREEIA
jgi:ADP-ribose pyrophosphatase YjhB (NUDIX family)